jgi:hypothetical protein
MNLERRETQLEKFSQNAMLYLGKHLAFEEIFSCCVSGLYFLPGTPAVSLAWDQYV